MHLLGLCSALVLSASGATFTGAHSGQTRLSTAQQSPSVSSTQEAGVSHSGVAAKSQYAGNRQRVVQVKAIRLTETSETSRPTTWSNIPEEMNPQLF
jgi:hypothetical protein